MAKLKKQDIGFTQIKNEVLDDKKLSWKAKGLFAYLFSKPDGWDFSSERIKDFAVDGSKSVLAGLKELEKNQYLERIRLSSGRMEYHLKYDKKPLIHLGREPKQHTAQTGEVSNKDFNTNTDKESNKDSNGQAIAGIIEVFDVFKRVNPAIKNMFGNKAQRGAAERLIKEFGLRRVLGRAEFAILILGKLYAPRVTTPYLLELKWVDLEAFYNEQHNKKESKSFKIAL